MYCNQEERPFLSWVYDGFLLKCALKVYYFRSKLFFGGKAKIILWHRTQVNDSKCTL